MTRPWSPLLSGDLAAAALAAAEAIAADLAVTASLISPFGPDPEFSLASGTAGQALFLGYLDEAVPGRGYRDLGEDLLRQAVEVAASRASSPGLWTGLSGVAWTVEHLRHRREEPWDREALDLARQAAQDGFAASGAGAAGLRQGAAGLAHLCNRLFQATGEEPFAEAARVWLGHVLEMRRPGEGIGGFRARVLDDWGRPVWTSDPGFLNGSAGIGLALLAAVSPVEPAWDRLLPALIRPGHPLPDAAPVLAAAPGAIDSRA